MQATDWVSEHSRALAEHLGKGMSYLEIAEAINARFNTSYSRNAVLGRARRMGLTGTSRPAHLPVLSSKARRSSYQQLREHYLSVAGRSIPVFEREQAISLRCVEARPRHLTLLELERVDCRYPYGGDEEGEAVTFCGQPCRAGSSYCAPHLGLTHRSGRPPKRPAATGAARRVEAT